MSTGAGLSKMFGSGVTEAAIVRDKKTGLSRGFGFCCFATADAVTKVLAIRQHLVLGHNVGVRRYAALN